MMVTMISFAPKRARSQPTKPPTAPPPTQPASRNNSSASQLSSPSNGASATAKNCAANQLTVAAHVENAGAKRDGDANADQGQRDGVDQDIAETVPGAQACKSGARPRSRAGSCRRARESRLAPQAPQAPRSPRRGSCSSRHPVTDFLSRRRAQGQRGRAGGPGSSPSPDRRPPTTSSRSDDSRQHAGAAIARAQQFAEHEIDRSHVETAGRVRGEDQAREYRQVRAPARASADCRPRGVRSRSAGLLGLDVIGADRLAAASARPGPGAANRAGASSRSTGW